jgi:hypothetical protein
MIQYQETSLQAVFIIIDTFRTLCKYKLLYFREKHKPFQPLIA